MRLAVVIPVLLLGACTSDDPPVIANHAAPLYRADLAACTAEAGDATDTFLKKRGPYFLSYPISYPIVHSRETTACLERRGYRLPTN